MMRKRLRKKLHKKYLDWYIIDLSYVGNILLTHRWRTRLFNADFFHPMMVNKSTLGTAEENGLGPREVRAVHRYNLMYQVTKLPYSEEGLSQKSYVTFRFQSIEFPEVSRDTINNLEA